MAEFLTTKGIAYHIETIITEARSQLIMVSPYLKISQTFSERLRDASKRGIAIQVIYGKDELNDKQRTILSLIDQLELYFSENLHAKCYFNDSKMVVTSMNMYEYSENNNREMGVLIKRNEDKELFENAMNEALSIKNASKRINLIKESRTEAGKKSKSKNTNHDTDGFCIRCGYDIQYDPLKPFCHECYQIWSEWENANFAENFCHGCGEPISTTMAAPQCKECYSRWKFAKKVG